MKALPAQRVAARYLVARILKGKVITKLWVVTDPGPKSTLLDIVYETTPAKLIDYAVGTGSALWRKENTTFHDDETSALADAKKRMTLRDAVQAEKGLYPVERGGKLLWVTVPKDS